MEGKNRALNGLIVNFFRHSEEQEGSERKAHRNHRNGQYRLYYSELLP